MFLKWRVFTTYIIVYIFLFPLQNIAYAAVDNTYLAELIAKSRQLGLAERPMWQKLGHYVPNLVFSGVHGLVDNPQFYNAPDGKYNPQSELEATLASFYSDIEESNEQQNPQCLFIARFAWLNHQLAFDQDRLPYQKCARYQKWYSALNPSGLSLIFASAYLNNPSSMYGHTLMRVDAKDQDEHTRLLAYAINFAANTNESNGLMFAINGLFGGYPGAFSILPYYVKVREYSDFENRDLWEYQLNLSPEEMDRVLMHAWELGSTYFQYFFFDENCSYQLLSLLQVARPELNFTNQFQWWAIPADTLRVVTKQKDIVRKVVYRPSSATTAKHRLKQLADSERDIVRKLSIQDLKINDPMLSALPDERAAAVLEASQDYVSYRRLTEKNDVVDSSMLARKLLKARSHLNVISPSLEAPVPETHPDKGHGSSRLALGAGQSKSNNFQELQARATYHDIMDSDNGYIRGAQIESFSINLRHYDFGETRVERFALIDILSLSPRDEFFKPMSWKISAGWQRTHSLNGTEPLAFSMNGSAGGAWSNEENTSLWYALLDGSSQFNSNLGNGYALGAGASAGLVFDLRSSWRIHGYVRTLRYFLGQLDTSSTLGLEQRISLGKENAIRFDLALSSKLLQNYNSFTLSLQHYF